MRRRAAVGAGDRPFSRTTTECRRNHLKGRQGDASNAVARRRRPTNFSLPPALVQALYLRTPVADPLARAVLAPGFA